MLSHGQGKRAHLRGPATSHSEHERDEVARSISAKPRQLESRHAEKKTCNAMAAGMSSAGSGYYWAILMVLCDTSDEYAPADLAGSVEAAKPRRSQLTQKSEARSLACERCN